MGFSKPLRIWGLIAFALPALFVTGCGKPSGPDESSEIGHIRNVLQLGREYIRAHNSKAPKDVAALRDWAIQEGKAQEDDFKSTRDGQDYLVAPGMMGNIMVFEAAGKGGIRYGTNPSSSIQEVTDDNVENWLKGVPGRQATRGRGGAADAK